MDNFNNVGELHRAGAKKQAYIGTPAEGII